MDYPYKAMYAFGVQVLAVLIVFSGFAVFSVFSNSQSAIHEITGILLCIFGLLCFLGIGFLIMINELIVQIVKIRIIQKEQQEDYISQTLTNRTK